MADSVPGTAPVTDHRIAPRGVLPRGMQTWLMIGLALGMLAIIVLTGQPEPVAHPVAPAMSQPLTPNPDRLRDYQDRLRMLDERARQQAITDPPASTPQPAYDDPPATATPDPFEAERKRREYESLFAANVVVSRRPDAERPVTDDRTRAQTLPPRTSEQAIPAPPSIDDVADAVIRATSRYAAVRPLHLQRVRTRARPLGRRRRRPLRHHRAAANAHRSQNGSRLLVLCIASSKARSSTPCSRTVWTVAGRRP